MAIETLEASRDAICGAFGVLPGLFNSATTGPMVREALRLFPVEDGHAIGVAEIVSGGQRLGLVALLARV